MWSKTAIWLVFAEVCGYISIVSDIYLAPLEMIVWKKSL